MPKYVIERTVPNAGDLTRDQLHGMSAQSNAVLGKLGRWIQWVHSYVSEDRLFCIYNADDKNVTVSMPVWAGSHATTSAKSVL